MDTPIYEHLLAETWNVTKARLAEARKQQLTADDYQRTPQGIVLPPASVDRLRVFLGIPPSEIEKSPEDGGGGGLDMIITRVWKANRHAVQAAAPAGAEYNVRVTDNRRLRPGMTLAACQPTHMPDTFQYSGPLPRR